MRAWNWFVRSRRDAADAAAERVAADERRDVIGATGSSPQSPRPLLETEIVERVRSVDGLNHWQQQQVRDIVREELALALARLEGASLAVQPVPEERPGKPRRVHRWPDNAPEIKPLLA